METGLRSLECVIDVHELHIWAITLGKVVLAVHVKIVPEANADEVGNPPAGRKCGPRF